MLRKLHAALRDFIRTCTDPRHSVAIGPPLASRDNGWCPIPSVVGAVQDGWRSHASVSGNSRAAQVPQIECEVGSRPGDSSTRHGVACLTHY